MEITYNLGLVKLEFQTLTAKFESGPGFKLHKFNLISQRTNYTKSCLRLLIYILTGNMTWELKQYISFKNG